MEASSTMGPTKPYESPFDRLPDDIVTHILTIGAITSPWKGRGADVFALSRFRTVCSRFNVLALDVKNLVISLSNKDLRICEGRIIDHLYLAEHVERLTLRLHPTETVCTRLLSSLAGCTPELESFAIYGANLEYLGPHQDTFTQQLFEVLSCCPKLTSIKVLDCPESALERSLSRKRAFQNLETLDMAIEKLSGFALRSIVEQCPCLKSLSSNSMEGPEYARIESSSLREITLYAGSHAGRADVIAPQLTDLTLIGFPVVSLDAQKLSYLAISSCSFQSKQPMKLQRLTLDAETWPFQSVANMLQIPASIEHLYFAFGMDILVRDPGEPDMNLPDILQKIEHLKGLSISDAIMTMLAWPADLTMRTLEELSVEIKLGEEGAFQNCINLVRGGRSLKVVSIGITGDHASVRNVISVARFVDLQKEFPELEFLKRLCLMLRGQLY